MACEYFLERSSPWYAFLLETWQSFQLSLRKKKEILIPLFDFKHAEVLVAELKISLPKKAVFVVATILWTCHSLKAQTVS